MYSNKLLQENNRKNHDLRESCVTAERANIALLKSATTMMAPLEHHLTMRQIQEGNKTDIATAFDALSIAYKKLGGVSKCLDYQWRTLAMQQAIENDEAGIIPEVKKDDESTSIISRTFSFTYDYETNYPDTAGSSNSDGSTYEEL